MIKSEYNDLYWKEILEVIWLWRKISLSLLKNISEMFTNHVYNYLTMCKQIADIGLNNWCYVAVMVGAICLCTGMWALAHLEYYLLSICL